MDKKDAEIHTLPVGKATVQLLAAELLSHKDKFTGAVVIGFRDDGDPTIMTTGMEVRDLSFAADALRLYVHACLGAVMTDDLV